MVNNKLIILSQFIFAQSFNAEYKIEMTEINITPFDNQISILYKWARHYKTSIYLIIVTPEIRDGKEVSAYANGVDIIQQKINDGMTLRQIYIDLADKLEIEDIVMVWALINRERDSEELFPIINGLYDELGIDQIQDVAELDLISGEWLENLRNQMVNDLNDLLALEAIHETLGRYNEVAYSPITVDRVTIKASPVLRSTRQPPAFDDALIMFDEATPSYNVPYIRYNSTGEKRQELFKIYQGRTDEEIPNYGIIVPASSQTNKDNSFYMTVWSGKGTVTKATKESFMNGFYNLSTNILTIKTPTEDDVNKETVITKITESMPIVIENVTETAITGNFYLFGLDINDIYLVDMIINEPLMSSYLFVKETSTSYAEKTQLKVYYKSFTGFEEEDEILTEGYIRTPASVTVSLTQHYAQGGKVVVIDSNGQFDASASDSCFRSDVFEGAPNKKRLAPGCPYVEAKITNAESLEVANRFVKIFSRLMQFYKARKPQVEKLFLSYIPEISSPDSNDIKSVKIKSKKAKTKRGTGDSKIERLKEVAPDIFVNGYARKCQCVFQPIAIPQDEVQAWENKTFLYKEVIKKRQVMAFPPDNPRFHFVCPNDSAPFPGVKHNKDLVNKDTYPCLPCCFKDDQIDPGVTSNYNECFRGQKTRKEEKVDVAKETHKIKTDKIAGPGRIGFVPKSISELISKYSGAAVDIVRMGVPNSVNSLLHCVSMGLQDPNYLALQTNELREQYVTRIRNIIAQQIVPNIMKQEMYDFTDEEISERFSDLTEFLDPNLFYRAIENSYNINLYVFSPPSKDDPSSLGNFELPRFKLFHSRSPRPEKRAILVFRTWGAESDSLEYPQCELIVDYDETNSKIVYNFGPDMNSLMQRALTTLNRTITWDITETDDNRKTIIARNNIYSLENYYYLLNKLPTHQIIDGYGKTRAFIFPAGDENVTIIIPSTQPENLPSGNITRVMHTTPVSIFGEPTAITKYNNMTDGLWYKALDLDYGIYIPIIPTSEYGNLKVGPSNPLVVEESEVVSRVRNLKRDLDTILQLIIWLYLLSGLDVPTFVNTYMSIEKNPIEDSSNVYDLSKIGVKLPVVNTVEEGINALRILSPSLFHPQYQNRLYMYSQKFFEGVVYYLRMYDHERKPRNPVIPTVIRRGDIRPEDFTTQRRVAVFTDEGDMRTWFNTLDKLSFKNIIIEDTLNISNALRTEPYLYSAPTGNIYLIQNVMGGDKSRAINVTYNWYLYKLNLGHKSPEFDTDKLGQFPVHVIYGISPAMAPTVIENHAGESTQYLQILSYGSMQHAAMLPLL